jgi:phosphoribosyl 1,2-cyclic phosphodiesterase
MEAGGVRMLIDVGFSIRQLERRLGEAGVGFGDLDLILISHEHSDHIKALDCVMRQTDLPIYVSSGLIDLIRPPYPGRVQAFHPGEPMEFKGCRILPFPVPHDALDPVGFCIVDLEDGFKATIMTDIGFPSLLAKEVARGSNLLVLEANHELDMLLSSGYPWPLKQRIMGDFGHLSNEQAAELVESSLCPELQHIFLVHLSEENNRPDLAASRVRDVLEGKGFGHIGLGISLQNSVVSWRRGG